MKPTIRVRQAFRNSPTADAPEFLGIRWWIAIFLGSTVSLALSLWPGGWSAAYDVLRWLFATWPRVWLINGAALGLLLFARRRSASAD
jgi:hypothetical protein